LSVWFTTEEGYCTAAKKVGIKNEVGESD